MRLATPLLILTLLAALAGCGGSSEATNGTAAIGSVDDAARIVRRESGTSVVQA